MLKNTIKSILARVGYEIRKKPRVGNNSQGYTLYTYLKPDGSFDYERYRQIQTEGNIRKLSWAQVREPNIKFLANFIRESIGQPKFGLCHGTRRGLEQKWFREYLNCEVIGTEISTTAVDFPHTIQWDFHEVKAEWIDSVDFIYSNSLDHSYNPEKCLSTWMSCVRPGGLCILEHTSLSSPDGASELDPFGADLHLMPYLITVWGNGKFCVRQLLSAPEKDPSVDYASFIVIQRL